MARRTRGRRAALPLDAVHWAGRLLVGRPGAPEMACAIAGALEHWAMHDAGGA